MKNDKLFKKCLAFENLLPLKVIVLGIHFERTHFLIIINIIILVVSEVV